jgi:hypothetical protein
MDVPATPPLTPGLSMPAPVMPPPAAANSVPPAAPVPAAVDGPPPPTPLPAMKPRPAQ